MVIDHGTIPEKKTQTKSKQKGYDLKKLKQKKSLKSDFCTSKVGPPSRSLQMELHTLL